MSNYYYKLLEKLNEINKNLKSEEKVRYPKLVRNRQRFEISLAIFLILYVLLIFSPWFLSNNIIIIYLILGMLVLDAVIITVYLLKYTHDFKEYSFSSFEKSRKVKKYIEDKFKKSPLEAVNGLMEECEAYILKRQRKYSLFSKTISVIMSLAIIPTFQFLLKSYFERNIFSISTNILLLIMVMLCLFCLIGLWDQLTNESFWGETSKNNELLYLLKEVRYLMYEGEQMTKRALISVSDKAGIVEFAQELKKLGWDIISTGGTKVALDNAGVDTIAIDDVTGFPEMMDGRVKTLHPNIHGGLLARRDLDSHLQAAKDNNIELIDLVVVNLYPFKETILKPDVTYADAVENIDIGGPSMLRSAAKNHASVTVVVDPADYAVVLDELSANGETSYETRQRLAAKVYRHTASYDALIAEYFTAQVGETKPEKLTLTYDLKQPMRYGENPQQDADFYQKGLPTAYSIASAKQLNGKELSFNNIRDADAAIRIIRDFKDRPTVVALKHMNPCGIGQADDIETAWDYAYEADPVSIFGGIVVLNHEVDAATAKKMHGVFLEIIIAPSYTDEALEILTTKKKNLRILELPFDAQDASEAEAEYTGVVGGLLVQNQDVIKESPADWQVVTKRQPTETEATALEFAWKAIKYVKSNGIIVTNDHMTLGVGPGQTNRVASVRIAIDQAKDRLDGAVLASDAFFPFADNVEEIAKAGIKAIIQPGGSVRDQESIEAADKHGLTMIFTGVRHFRH